MLRNFTLEFWRDDDWYVGRLKEIPRVFSQGETLAELEDNIRDAYQLMKDDAPAPEVALVETKKSASKFSSRFLAAS